jgi:predicted RecA/RadA family phage recombinase
MIKISDTVGVIVETAAVGVETALVYSCEKIVVPKDTGVVFAAGAKVYYKAGTAAVTSTASGNTLCGRCLVAGLTGDTELEIDLHGDVPA